MRTYDCDVLVIGSGSAGLQAGLSAAEAGARVVIVDKGQAGRSGSTVGAQQLCGVGSWCLAEDSVDLHFQDSLKGGQYLNDQSPLRVLVEEAGPRIEELIRRGLAFDQGADGRYVLAPVAGHTAPRSLAKGDSTGRHVADLLRKACSQAGVRFLQDHFTVALTGGPDRVTGAVLLDLVQGELAVAAAGAVILATGGAGQLYPLTTNPIQATGDGYALALGAGATLCDTEMFQFYPVCLVAPKGLRGVPIGLSEYGALRNAAGERFMTRYDPVRGERATRDLLSYGIYSEIREGRGSPAGGVFLDATGHPDDVYRLFAWEYKQCLSFGLDLKHQMAEICPAAHYYMGGVRADLEGFAGIPGLFAAGEVTGGIHGANRLGNNSVADCLVMGHRAGLRAAGEGSGGRAAVDWHEVSRHQQRLQGLLDRPRTGANAFALRNRLQGLMWEHFGIIRTGTEMESGLAQLAGLDVAVSQVPVHTQTLVANQELQQVLELENMVLIARCLAESALQRTESRGAHARGDYRQQDPAWLQHITVRLDDGRLGFGTAPVDASRVPLPVS